MDLQVLKTVWDESWPVLTAICTVASALDATLPQPAAGSHWIPVRKVISFFGVNVKNASNGAQPSFATWLIRIVQPIIAAQNKSDQPEVNYIPPTNGAPNA